MKPWLYVLGAAVIIISSACIVVNSLRLAGVGELISPDPALGGDSVRVGLFDLVYDKHTPWCQKLFFVLLSTSIKLD